MDSDRAYLYHGSVIVERSTSLVDTRTCNNNDKLCNIVRDMYMSFQLKALGPNKQTTLAEVKRCISLCWRYMCMVPNT